MKLRYFMQWVFKQGVRHSTSKYFHWYVYLLFCSGVLYFILSKVRLDMSTLHYFTQLLWLLFSMAQLNPLSWHHLSQPYYSTASTWIYSAQIINYFDLLLF